MSTYVCSVYTPIQQTEVSSLSESIEFQQQKPMSRTCCTPGRERLCGGGSAPIHTLDRDGDRRCAATLARDCSSFIPSSITSAALRINQQQNPQVTVDWHLRPLVHLFTRGQHGPNGYQAGRRRQRVGSLFGSRLSRPTSSPRLHGTS